MALATEPLPSATAPPDLPDGRAISEPLISIGRPLVTAAAAERLQRHRAVVVWAVLGAAWVVYCLVGWLGWALSDDFTPAPKGRDHIPDHTLIAVRAIEAGSVLFMLWMLRRYLIEPWRRHRRLSPDGMLLIGCTFAFFLDPLINVFDYAFAWNAYNVNFGSWGDFIPGHRGSQHYGEGLLWAWPDYVVFGLVGALLGCKLIMHLQGRFARMSTPTAFAIWFCVFFVGATVIEFTESRLGLFSYSRAWSELSLFDGRQYQWPLYSDFFTAICCTCFTYLRWSWIVRGRSFLDAGIEHLPTGERGRQLVLLLAVIGFSAAVWAIWFVGMSWMSVTADSVADLPSYMQPGR